jgi:hypothetical protein
MYSFSFAGTTDVLAWETTRDQVHLPVVDRGGRKRANVVPAAGVRPVLRENLAAELADLDLPGAGEPGAVET